MGLLNLMHRKRFPFLRAWKRASAPCGAAVSAAPRTLARDQVRDRRPSSDNAPIEAPSGARIGVRCAPAWLLASAIALAGACPAAAQTSIKFSLDGRLEGPDALVLLPQDKGYFKTEGLDVSVDDAASPLEPITRVASGSYHMAFADINALIRYREQNPSPPLKAG